MQDEIRKGEEVQTEAGSHENAESVDSFIELKKLVEGANSFEDFIDVLNRIGEIAFHKTEYHRTEDGELQKIETTDTYTGEEFIKAIKQAFCDPFNKELENNPKTLYEKREHILDLDRSKDEEEEGVGMIEIAKKDMQGEKKAGMIIDLRAKAHQLLDKFKADPRPEDVKRQRIEDKLTKPPFEEGNIFVPDSNSELKFKIFEATTEGKDEILFSDLSEGLQDKIRESYFFQEETKPNNETVVIRRESPIWLMLERDYVNLKGALSLKKAVENGKSKLSITKDDKDLDNFGRRYLKNFFGSGILKGSKEWDYFLENEIIDIDEVLGVNRKRGEKRKEADGWKSENWKKLNGLRESPEFEQNNPHDEIAWILYNSRDIEVREKFIAAISDAVAKAVNEDREEITLNDLKDCRNEIIKNVSFLREKSPGSTVVMNSKSDFWPKVDKTIIEQEIQ